MTHHTNDCYNVNSTSEVAVASEASATQSGSPATLTCTVEASDAGVDILWYKDTTTALSDSDDAYTIATTLATTAGADSITMTSSSSLEIVSFESADVGAYSCAVDYTAPILDDSSGDQDMSVLGK